MAGPTDSRALRPTETAADRELAADLALGALGFSGMVVALVRLVESWQVSPAPGPHQISVFGQRLAYPAANIQAIVVLVLAALALIATARALRRALRELTGASRFRSRLRDLSSETFDGALVIDDERPLVFCAGLRRPDIYVSTGALAMLDDRALRAVLDHERHHVRRRDPLRLAACRVLHEALFFIPGPRELTRRQQSLAELCADEGAIRTAPENRAGLAQAMLILSDSSSDANRVGFDPQRVDSLLGQAPSWRFPALLCIATATFLVVAGAVAFLAGRAASGSATLAPPFLSREPCVITLAAAAAATVGFALRCSRRLRDARR